MFNRKVRNSLTKRIFCVNFTSDRVRKLWEKRWAQMKGEFVLVLVNQTRLTTTNFISLFLSPKGKHGFKAHDCCLWHYGSAESSKELPDAYVY